MSGAAKQAASEAGKKAAVRSFRDLVAWQRGMELAELVYSETRQFGESERFGLVAQMRRAAVSIPWNIAEGFARQSLGDYLKFLRIARGSLAELGTQAELAARVGLYGFGPQLQDLIEEEARILNALIRSLERKEHA